ncbi:DUF2493 domain-containing protein [Myroides sp. WP-1]|uniref:DUF2493 domain-containing protein n=1 Tax=Myroides sp. WP-1 TaxID=2759944 RepID=UPI0015FB5027|nr:DUF2493 domain-containing protein [Myroides sp. WP-1]MBB1137952.1 DUF2493 domain-containing protein [Myroides sp. WP-1]
MKLAIIGSRKFTDFQLLNKTVTTYCKLHHIVPITIVSGGAKGADTLAEQFAKVHNLEMKIFYPDWELLGRQACSARNTQIVAYADLIFAFWNGSSPGTKDSMTKAEQMNKKLIIINYTNL